MNDLRFGTFVRAERRRRNYRQVDVADRAGVAQQTVSVIERGRLDEVTLRCIRAVAGAVEVGVRLEPRGRGPEPDRLLDARHAGLVRAVIAALGPEWIVLAEYTFNDFGDRGAVDVLAWHPRRRALLLVEVKSEVDDTQAVLRSMDVRVRVVPRAVGRERGWVAVSVGSVLVLPSETSTRRTIAAHGPLFDRVLPARTVQVRRWLRDPATPIRGIWFVPDTSPRRAKRNPGSPGRIRQPGRLPNHAHEGPGEAANGRSPRAGST